MSGDSDITFLLVEDDDVDAEGVSRAFSKKQLSNSIVRARDGLEALDFLSNNTVQQPFVILLDLNLPRMNGIEFLNSLRQHPTFGNSVVFVLTTSSSDKDISASYAKQISGYFVKEEMGSTFSELARLLSSYEKIVKLPIGS